MLCANNAQLGATNITPSPYQEQIPKGTPIHPPQGTHNPTHLISSEIILHLAQSGHDLDRVGLARGPLNVRIMDAHEDVVSLGLPIISTGIAILGWILKKHVWTNLFVADRRFAWCFLFLLCQRLRTLNGLGSRHGHGEFDVCFGVFVARLPLSVAEPPIQ